MKDVLTLNKILITGFPTMGGSGMIATRLGVELSREFEVHFLFYKKPFFLKESEFNNVIFHNLDLVNYALFSEIGSLYTIQAANAILDIIDKYNIDILHSHYAIPHSVVASLVKKLRNVKIITTTHGSDVHTLGKHNNFKSVLSDALQNHDCVTSVSDYLSNLTESVFNIEGVKTIYDFVNTDIFKPNKNKEHYIVQASNFRPVKQIPKMIDIFSKVADNFPQWKLKLIGDGPDWGVAIRKARLLGIKNQVEFPGIVPDIPKIFGNAAIMMSTSKVESFGMTIAEAMSCETPVVAPNVGGIPEVLGSTGFLYESDEDAVEQLSKLMENEKLRIRMGKQARDRIVNNFSIDRIVEKYSHLYRTIMN